MFCELHQLVPDPGDSGQIPEVTAVMLSEFKYTGAFSFMGYRKIEVAEHKVYPFVGSRRRKEYTSMEI